MDYSQIEIDELIETRSCVSSTPNILLPITQKDTASLTISDEVNQMPHRTTPSGG